MSVWDVVFFIILAAILYSLVRPGSPAHAAIVAISDLAEGLVGTATGYQFRKGG